MAIKIPGSDQIPENCSEQISTSIIEKALNESIGKSSVESFLEPNGAAGISPDKDLLKEVDKALDYY